MTMKLGWAIATISLGVVVGVSPAHGFSLSLYDGTNAAQPLPVNQGQLFGAALQSNGSPTILDETVDPGTGVIVISDGNSAEYGGYTNFIPIPPPGSFVNPAFPALDPTVGYSLSFRVGFEVLDSSSPNRAGFSVILISSNGQGIELGLNPSSIFAQSSTFVAAESGLFNNLSATSNNYVVTVLGNNYQLFANGSPILSGSLRSYVFNPAASIPPLTFNPYTTNNFLFLGDNTGQGSSTFILESAAIASVPVPPQFIGIMLLGMTQLWRRLLKLESAGINPTVPKRP